MKNKTFLVRSPAVVGDWIKFKSFDGKVVFGEVWSLRISKYSLTIDVDGGSLSLDYDPSTESGFNEKALSLLLEVRGKESQ